MSFYVSALLKSGTKASDTSNSNSSKSSFAGVVVKCETSENDDDANFVDPASTSSRSYPDNLLTDEDQLVIPNLSKYCRTNPSFTTPVFRFLYYCIGSLFSYSCQHF